MSSAKANSNSRNSCVGRHHVKEIFCSKLSSRDIVSMKSSLFVVTIECICQYFGTGSCAAEIELVVDVYIIHFSPIVIVYPIPFIFSVMTIPFQFISSPYIKGNIRKSVLLES